MPKESLNPTARFFLSSIAHITLIASPFYLARCDGIASPRLGSDTQNGTHATARTTMVTKLLVTLSDVRSSGLCAWMRSAETLLEDRQHPLEPRHCVDTLIMLFEHHSPAQWPPSPTSFSGEAQGAQARIGSRLWAHPDLGPRVLIDRAGACQREIATLVGTIAARQVGVVTELIAEEVRRRRTCRAIDRNRYGCDNSIIATHAHGTKRGRIRVGFRAQANLDARRTSARQRGR